MSNVTKIHQSKQPVRKHFIAEWLIARDMTPMDLLTALNDPDRPMELGEVDKSQVYRWLKGQLPQPPMMLRVADVLSLEDPADLLREPENDWFTQFFKDRDEDEIARMKLMLEAAFPKKRA